MHRHVRRTAKGFASHLHLHGADYLRAPRRSPFLGEGLTLAASKLQHEGLIRYSRSRIEVIDRPKLEKRVCECYEVVKKEYERLALLKPRR